MIKRIPIALSTIYLYKKNYFYYLCYLIYGADSIYFDFESHNVFIYFPKHDNETILDTYKQVGLTKRTWRDFINSNIDLKDKIVVLKNEYAEVMSISLFNQLNAKLAAENATFMTYNAVWRVFGYYYFNCLYSEVADKDMHLFQRSQTLIAQDLEISQSRISEITKQLIEWGFLERVGKYKVGEFARQYRIPEDKR